MKSATEEIRALKARGRGGNAAVAPLTITLAATNVAVAPVARASAPPPDWTVGLTAPEEEASSGSGGVEDLEKENGELKAELAELKEKIGMLGEAACLQCTHNLHDNLELVGLDY